MSSGLRKHLNYHIAVIITDLRLDTKMDDMKACRKRQEVISIALWWLPAVQVIKPTSFMLADGTSSYHTDVCLCSFSSKFGFNLFSDAIKMGWDIMIDSWDRLAIGQTSVSAGLRYHGHTPWLLVRSVWHQMCKWRIKYMNLKTLTRQKSVDDQL